MISSRLYIGRALKCLSQLYEEFYDSALVLENNLCYICMTYFEYALDISKQQQTDIFFNNRPTTDMERTLISQQWSCKQCAFS